MDRERVMPESCGIMSEVRAGVDELDNELVSLLAERFRYMNAAARIKASRDAVRDEWRKADVLSKVRALAEQKGAPVERVVEFYETLIESSIAYELAAWDAK